MSGIVWLASYPKSGNTWVRVFLANYIRNLATPVDINELEGDYIASSREVFDEVTGLEASDLTASEIARLRPAVYRALAARTSETILMKTHDAFCRTESGEAIVGDQQATHGVVYLIRNPLDVAVSLAHHTGGGIDRTVDHIVKENARAADQAGYLPRQLPQALGSWGEHVRSWVDQSGLPVRVVRYEDLVADPVENFTAIVDAVGLSLDRERVVRAMGFSSFEELQAQESRNSFRERTDRAGKFFRKGVVGDWREQLSGAQADRIIAAHHDTMRRYGYLEDAAGRSWSPTRPGALASSANPLPGTESAPTGH